MNISNLSASLSTLMDSINSISGQDDNMSGIAKDVLETLSTRIQQLMTKVEAMAIDGIQAHEVPFLVMVLDKISEAIDGLMEAGKNVLGPEIMEGLEEIQAMIKELVEDLVSGEFFEDEEGVGEMGAGKENSGTLANHAGAGPSVGKDIEKKGQALKPKAEHLEKILDMMHKILDVGTDLALDRVAENPVFDKMRRLGRSG